MGVDFRKYTRREAGKQLAALEIHLRQFVGENDIFCLECCGKHLLAIEALADEGVTFFPEDDQFWKDLAAWVRGILDASEEGRISAAFAKQWADESRNNRKEIQSRYMGQMGQCECVTGFEPCCKVKKG